MPRKASESALLVTAVIATTLIIAFAAYSNSSVTGEAANGNRPTKCGNLVCNKGETAVSCSTDCACGTSGNGAKTWLGNNACCSGLYNSNGVCCPSGSVWDGTVCATQPSDTAPPVRSNGAPTGQLPSGITTTTLSLSTNEVATCRYSTTAGTSYDAMTRTFASSGGQSHTASVATADGQTYTYYVRCMDSATNKNTDDYTITFSVATTCIDTTWTPNATSKCGAVSQTSNCGSTRTVNGSLTCQAGFTCSNNQCVQSQITCPAAATNAFTACYYDNQDLTNLKVSRIDNAINFDWSTESPDQSIGPDQFSATWSGNFNFNAGTYTFTTTSDDGLRVYIDGALVFNDWVNHQAITNTFTRTLSAGTHLVRVEYYEGTSFAVAKMSWSQTTQTCGNGVTEGTEMCDLGSTNNGACPKTCSASCTTNNCTCTDTNWTPSLSNLCGSVTQTSNCGTTRTMQGNVTCATGQTCTNNQCVTSGGTCNLVTGQTAKPATTLAKPGYLQSVIDPQFGTKITRITGDPGTPIPVIGGTWPDLIYGNYPKDPVWTADQKLIVLKQTSGMGAIFLDGDTYQPLFKRNGPSGGGEWRLHPTLPDVAVYLNSNGAVGHWNVRTNTVTVKIPAVSGYTSYEMGPNEGGLSYDGRYIVAKAVRQSDNHLVGIYMDVDAGTRGAVVDLTAAGITDLDWVSVSALGNYIVAYGVISGGAQRTRVWTKTGTLIGTWNDYTFGHYDLGIDPAGNEVAFGAVGQSPYAHHFIARKLSDGTIADLTGAVTTYNWHAGTRNTAHPGWGYEAVNDNGGYPFDGEIDAIKLDGSKTVLRLAHHRSNNIDYDSAPMPTASPDGKRVLFGSNWGASSGRPIQTYVLDTRDICPKLP